MNTPPKEQIIEVAKSNPEAHQALRTLFPDIIPIQEYNWGSGRITSLKDPIIECVGKALRLDPTYKWTLDTKDDSQILIASR